MQKIISVKPMVSLNAKDNLKWCRLHRLRWCVFFALQLKGWKDFLSSNFDVFFTSYPNKPCKNRFIQFEPICIEIEPIFNSFESIFIAFKLIFITFGSNFSNFIQKGLRNQFFSFFFFKLQSSHFCVVPIHVQPSPSINHRSTSF